MPSPQRRQRQRRPSRHALLLRDDGDDEVDDVVIVPKWLWTEMAGESKIGASGVWGREREMRIPGQFDVSEDGPGEDEDEKGRAGAGGGDENVRPRGTAFFVGPRGQWADGVPAGVASRLQEGTVKRVGGRAEVVNVERRHFDKGVASGARSGAGERKTRPTRHRRSRSCMSGESVWHTVSACLHLPVPYFASQHSESGDDENEPWSSEGYAGEGFVIPMPSGREPSPYDYPGMTDDEIVAFKKRYGQRLQSLEKPEVRGEAVESDCPPLKQLSVCPSRTVIARKPVASPARREADRRSGSGKCVAMLGFKLLDDPFTTNQPGSLSPAFETSKGSLEDPISQKFWRSDSQSSQALDSASLSERLPPVLLVTPEQARIPPSARMSSVSSAGTRPLRRHSSFVLHCLRERLENIDRLDTLNTRAELLGGYLPESKSSKVACHPSDCERAETRTKSGN
ncbi:MAG: hypothetical protein M1833_004024 [Piccolia ochrophora]|nr:MAG: hypothetical protein M1833_004024 [Piccolia ochrophora]